MVLLTWLKYAETLGKVDNSVPLQAKTPTQFHKKKVKRSFCLPEGSWCEIHCVNSLILAKPTLSHSCIVFTRPVSKSFKKIPAASSFKMFAQVQKGSTAIFPISKTREKVKLCLRNKDSHQGRLLTIAGV